MSIGSAIARGVLKGIGVGGMAVADEKRRDREREADKKVQFEVMDYQHGKQMAMQEWMRANQLADIKDERAYQAGLLKDERAYQEGQAEIAHGRNVELEGVRVAGRIKVAGYTASANAREERKTHIHRATIARIQSMGNGDAMFDALKTRSPGELADMYARTYMQNFPAAQQPEAYQYAMEQVNGKSKTELVAMNGGVKADYSQYIGTEFEELIPRAQPLGGVEDSGMGDIYTYDPTKSPIQISEEVDDLTDFELKNKMVVDFVTRSAESETGYAVDPSVAQHISTQIGANPEKIMGEQGAAFELRTNQALNGLIKSGQVVNVNGKLVFADDAAAQKAEQEVRAERIEASKSARVGEGTVLAPQVEPSETATDALATKAAEEIPLLGETAFESPAKKEFFEKERIKEVQGKATKLAKDFNKTATIATHDTLGNLMEEVEQMDPEVQSYLYGAGSLLDVIKDLQAKSGDPAAQEALAFLSRLESFAGKVRHEQFGSAQTEGEMKSWYKQLSEPGILKNPDTLRAQLESKKTLMETDIRSIAGAYDPEVREAWQAQNPSFDVRAHLQLDSGPASPLAKLPQEVRAAVMEDLKEVPVEDHDEYINYVLSQLE